MRALYGVCACAAQLEGVKQRGGPGARQVGTDLAAAADNSGMPEVAAQALLVKYAKQGEMKLAGVRAMLRAQRLL